MSVTIQLDDALATQLRSRAQAGQVSLEEFARYLLGDALRQLELKERSQAEQQRRLALIRKSASAPLTPEEEEELRQLQEALDRRLEQADDQLLDGLDRLRQAADQLADGQGR